MAVSTVAEMVVSTVTDSMDCELTESTAPAASSVWNSVTTVGGDVDGDTVSAVETSSSAEFSVNCMKSCFSLRYRNCCRFSFVSCKN